MMMNLFSIFDPSTSSSMSLNWISALISCTLIPTLFWSTPSRIHYIWITLSSYLLTELKTIFSKSKMKFLMIFITIFWFILSCNFLGLFPYIFTPTSHINLTSTLALPLWMSFMLYGWTNQMNYMFAHLVPNGTPLFLSVFMVCIETISNLIRPLTLAVRLTANMISGHLLLCLLSNLLQFMPSLGIIIMPPLMTLLTLETAVALIQSYVFVTLTSLYLNELN
uniref:ATP synthase F0 subunit 6 n=1 Tax=Ornithodoros tartakovskyi TaxID=570969 RepID=UPI002237DE38|nr:ATP synthase F0 subunit 6 [Ornithodoros tartakovskyi]UYB78669.1 ATP synthase F0 subunit 6 [Ornithodoros tartakovskyi]UYB78682.1 ATP synthase F0 subunit 6 [Ornithodoros tartakovskyi]